MGFTPLNPSYGLISPLANPAFRFAPCGLQLTTNVMPFVESSMMSRVEYDEDASELDSTFKSGKIYRYREVPPDIYSDLFDAESKGEFFNEKIKDAFDFVEVVVSRRR
jgi:hypothetical protein